MLLACLFIFIKHIVIKLSIKHLFCVMYISQMPMHRINLSAHGYVSIFKEILDVYVNESRVLFCYVETLLDMNNYFNTSYQLINCKKGTKQTYLNIYIFIDNI